MKKSNKTVLEKLEKQKRAISMVFIFLLSTQLFLFYGISGMSKDFEGVSKEYSELYVDTEQAFIDDVVRPQIRLELYAIRQAWVQYLVTHKDTELMLKDYAGRYIYADTNGNTLSYNEKTMILEKSLNYFNIRDKKTGEFLLKNCRQQWNREQVKAILDIIATPVKAFGSTGDVIIFDSFTGEMIIDNSEDCKDTPEVLGSDGKRYITLDYRHPANKNPEACKRVVENEMIWRKDTDHNSKMVYYFSEPIDMGKDANNFVKYPLGEYNREFQEKIILPYESVGVEGQPMQITVVLGAQEAEVSAAFEKIKDDFFEAQNDFSNFVSDSILFPFASVIMSLVVILLAMFVLRLNAYQCKVCMREKDSDSKK